MNAAVTIGDVVQDACLARLGEDADTRATRLQAYRPALRQVRDDYRSGRAPNFSDPAIRAAYALAYAPHHAALAEAIFSSIDVASLVHQEGTSVTVLGAGPAPEVAALAHVLGEGGTRELTVDLVDREPGWLRTRATTVDLTLERLIGVPQVTHTAHVADLQSGAGMEGIAHLLTARLVIAQALLTEIPSPTGVGTLLDALAQNIGEETSLIIIDYSRLERTGTALRHVHASSDLLTIFSGDLSIPCVRSHPEILSTLYKDVDLLRERRRSMAVVARVLVRPGFRRRDPETSIDHTPSQRAALDTYRSLLKNSSPRVQLISGEAGTGKSSLFPTMVRLAREAGLDAVVLAPTGTATRRVQRIAAAAGGTIHSRIYQYSEMIHRSLGQSGDGDDDQQPPVFKFLPREPPTEPAVYLVDEASMIKNCATESESEAVDVVFGDGRVLADLLAYCLSAENSRVVLVGDRDQLAPIGESSPSAFDSDVIKELTGQEPACSTLTEPVRFDIDSPILEAARRYRDGEAGGPVGLHEDPGRSLSVLGSPGQLPSWLEAAVMVGTSTIIGATNAGVSRWNRRLRSHAGRTDVPEKGDRLLVIRTDLRTGLATGDELIISDVRNSTAVRLRDEEIVLRDLSARFLTISGTWIELDLTVIQDVLDSPQLELQRKASQILYVNFLLRTGLKPRDPSFKEEFLADPQLNAIRATYSYARTCHRAQGGEWDRVVVDASHSRSFGPRWGYTAVTRARSALWLVNVGRQRSDPETLAQDVRSLLESEAFEVESIELIQHGVKVTVRRGDQAGQADVLLKNGQPSSATQKGPPTDVGRLLVRTVREWIDEVTARPLAEELEGVEEDLRQLLVGRGATCDLTSIAELQVRVAVRRGPNEASLILHHTASGRLTREREAAATGDPSLLVEVRAAIAKVQEK